MARSRNALDRVESDLAPGYIETEINRDFLATEAGQHMRGRIPQRRFGGLMLA
jgi:hypothetical protein